MEEILQQVSSDIEGVLQRKSSDPCCYQILYSFNKLITKICP